MADGAVVYQNTKEISPYEIPEQQAGTSRNIGFATINEVQTSRQHDSTIGQPETLQTTSVNRSTANNTKPNLKRFYNVFIAVGVLAVVLAIVLCTILVTKNEIMNISLQLQDQINSNKALIVAQTTDLGNKTEFLLTENENTKEFSLQLEEKVNNNKGLIVNQTADLGSKTEFLLTENENTKEFTLELEEKVNNNGLIVNQTADLGNKTDFLLTEYENTKQITLEFEDKINRNNELILLSMRCSEPLGIEDSRIKNSQMTASSQYNSRHAPYFARLHLQKSGGSDACWAPANFTAGTQWIQITLNERQIISAVITQGRPADYDQYVSAFNLQHSNDGTTWTHVQDNSGAIKLFIGNTDRLTPVTNYLPSPVVTKYIRLIPQPPSCMRMELLGCSRTGE